ncbi:piggyBac transposable element-derived protein 4-like [Schistocerca cancellata]|uniref:piggyBac transposable element-derived protein 4-like n=1 Tax=Schistocerca cancellata TaxID=274614 RepID=UPI002118DDEE|nr:piggyBac transposable element-derived protein 4-like [Schistocerca cancellata]
MLMMMWTMFKKKFLAVQYIIMTLFENTTLLIDSEEESRCPSTSAASNPVDIVPEERARLTARGKPRPFRPEQCISRIFFIFPDRQYDETYKGKTNLYAQQCIRKLQSTNSLSPTCSLSKCKGVTLMEIRKFLAIVVHICVSVRPRIGEHWSKNPVVSFKRKGETGYDPLHKVGPLLDNVCANFQCAYTLSQKITIDEGMCKFRGHVYFKQYMPQKPNKYSMKLYMLSESDTGYIWNFSVYAGERSDTVALVKTLLAKLSGKGYTLFTDRFYTSPILASELEAAKTALVETTRKSQQG